MKTITLQTNYNNKLSCDCFTHIDEAPASLILESVLQTTIVEIKTSDGSHPPVKARLVDFLRIPLTRIDTSYTWPSHGMDSNQFFDWILTNKPAYGPLKAMAVYYYKKETTK